MEKLYFDGDQDTSYFPKHRQDKSVNCNNDSSSYSLSNLIHCEMLNFKIIDNDLQYDFQITYKNEKWKIYRTHTELKNMIVSLRNLKYSFLPEEDSIIFKELKGEVLKEIPVEIVKLLKYIIYRADVMSNVITQQFFAFSESSEQEVLKHKFNLENLEQIYNFKLEPSDMTISDFAYDFDSGLLIIGMEDVSIFSSIGRFWSLIDYEILGTVQIFQRVFDRENQPYFRKLISKCFDARVSKIEISKEYNKIFIGLDNGFIQILNINVIEKIHDKLIIINDANNFKLLNDRITGIKCFNEFVYLASRENKIIICDISSNVLEVKFNGSLKKRVEGKGHIKDIKIDQNNKKLFVFMATNKILVYEIIQNNVSEVKINYLNEIECENNLKDSCLRPDILFAAYENKIQNFSFKNNSTDFTSIPLDGSIGNEISHSTHYFRIDYSIQVSAINYFSKMKLIVIGLSNGIIVSFNAKNFEVNYARKISENRISKLLILEDNYILIAGDEKSAIYFFKFG